MSIRHHLRAAVIIVTLSFSTTLFARSTPTKTSASKSTSTAKITESAKTKKKLSKHSSRPLVRSAKAKKRTRYYEHFYTSSFSTDNTEGDVTAGEDPIVRAAAIDALGNMNGTVVAIDPETGRILTMVNQKLALSEGAQPCSTFKVAVGLAALSEGLITKDTNVLLGRRTKMNLTYALAHSNNAYFEEMGRRLGFEKVSYYAQQFGLGELAGYNIEGEHLGAFPSEELSAKLGGVGKMCSFGESISLTPLQLGAMVASIANNGSLYYLQHPTSQDEVLNFHPKLKRTLDIATYIPEVTEGMNGAVEYGTARSVRYNFSEEQILGKTGTCSKDGTRFGWFASYANTQHGRIVTVVFLRGGRPTFGPKAAEIAGRMYRNLYDHSFFAVNAAPTPVRSAVSQ
ncbi:MAG: penicillin-binding protein transpeptidase [Acidobacteriales bacterium]|nr:penicillin-binding protein transpeptidase [Terriglobales bacterium]